VDLKLTRNFN